MSASVYDTLAKKGPRMLRSLLSAVSFCAALAFAQPQAKTPPARVTPEETRANQMLVNALADKNPDTRKEAAAAFGLAGAREPYLTELGGALYDKDVYVRAAPCESTLGLPAD